ncbi:MULTISPECIES: nitrile hydratase subunit alpha [Agrobacterium]|uniref:Nitrile hydratase subunit alpha n=1 Tax=Agrobacterium rubi TaxID=28099 RepID=A0AAE7UQV0_9HYPH|nr:MULTISPECIES: nitrile hydratase subunit alpha [Agrobacterium]MBN7807826.1 nitrile hydratase subunit alpha [Agrobacterium rosae]NTE89786.1 nitrile hydratase subunit alpha [Agrobacterium rubi]NTF05364.1 nitrile hydratase subunit alpha [Agrobacterium rubi]NTF10480.1 nitrile hydratase subunit alpha [Agrobacterium rubi]NTF22874.1 nitrile hydratase subunit alpha [Agrobacterium rubi]
MSEFCDGHHEHGHDLEHDHDHPHSHSEPSPESIALLETVLRSLIYRGVITEVELEAKMRQADAGDWTNGARIVVKAWTDPAFKQQMLQDGRAAVGAADISIPPMGPLGWLEDRDDLHHLVVCTLCSCYPRWLLGYPPEWYKDPVYRARAVRNPRALLAEWDLPFAEEVEVRTVDSTADFRWLVLPQRPAGTDGWSEEQLLELLTPNCLIGAELPKQPNGLR